MAPLAHYQDYTSTWDKKNGVNGDYTTLQTLLNKLFYLPEKEFNRQLGTMLDVEQIITYFAIEYAIASDDCFTKNMYWYFNSEKNLWSVIPWDNDSTFGDNWQGEYSATRETIYRIESLHHNLLLQRILDNEEWNIKFVEKINTVLKDGFTFLSTCLDSTYNIIHQDVWSDSKKICTNTEFDNEISVLHTFLENRTLNNADIVTFPKTGLYNYYCSNPNPTPDDNKIIFRATAKEKQNVAVKYCTDLQWDVPGSNFSIQSLKLWDDGNHNDSLAGDLIYGNELIFTMTDSNLAPFCFTANQNNYPQNGLNYLPHVRTNMMTLLFSKRKNPVENIRIGKVYAYSGNYFIELLNKGSQNIDLSCFHVRVDTCYQDFMIPENTTLQANKSLYIVSNQSFSATLTRFSPSVGNMCFDVTPGDSIFLLSPLLTPITAGICSDYEMIDYEQQDLVINEINYHSCNDFDPGDWLELYNPNKTAVDVSGWVFKDENDEHVFILPQTTVIEAKGYLTLCEDKTCFAALFPLVNIVSADFGFGLANGGELLRLYDAGGMLIDSVRYDDSHPWPTAADGIGPTLELIHCDMDNSLAEN